MFSERFLYNMDDEIERIIEWSLQEDLDEDGDITSKAIIPDESIKLSAHMLMKSDGIIAGLDLAKRIFTKLDPAARFETTYQDGNKVFMGDIIATVEGSARSLLAGERTALNILQHLSGIATEARRFVDAVQGCDVSILDTRKTTPALRYLEKYAAHVGGAANHRIGLFDEILIKDNHIKQAGGIIPATERVRKAYPNKPIEVEVETLNEVNEALEAGCDIVLLDNMNAKMLREAVKIINGRALSEASGGVNISNLREIAETGVDRISIGAITKDAHPLDISMKVIDRTHE